jgi:anti-sigma-K factor RskA
MTAPSAEVHALVGAYALDALDHDEQQAFEAHLSTCPVCADELAGFRATVERLGTAVAVQPPTQLRQQILSAAARTPQERPVVVPFRRSSQRWRRRAPLLAAAAALVAVAGTVGLYVGERDQVSDLQQREQLVAAVLSDDDAVQRSDQLDSGTTMKVVSSAEQDRAVVVMSKVPPLQQARNYQLWAIEPDGSTRSLAIMDDEDVKGTSSTLIDGVDDATTVAVTIEPEGGSSEPTTPPVLSVDLT